MWSKFWTGLVPVLLLTGGLTIAGNELLGVDPFLKVVSATAIVFMSFALVGLATGLGAKHPRFHADNATQVAGSYGGVAFMMAGMFFLLVVIGLLGWPSSVYLYHQTRDVPMPVVRQALVAVCFLAAAGMSVMTWLLSMRAGVSALQQMDRTPS